MFQNRFWYKSEKISWKDQSNKKPRGGTKWSNRVKDELKIVKYPSRQNRKKSSLFWVPN